MPAAAVQPGPTLTRDYDAAETSAYLEEALELDRVRGFLHLHLIKDGFDPGLVDVGIYGVDLDHAAAMLEVAAKAMRARVRR